MNRAFLGWLSCAASVILVLIALAATYMALTEAYGVGPPYFGETQNMDKWSDPISILAAICIICFASAAALWKFGVSFLRGPNDT